jgi:hypothetical protein
VLILSLENYRETFSFVFNFLLCICEIWVYWDFRAFGFFFFLTKQRAEKKSQLHAKTAAKQQS